MKEIDRSAHKLVGCLSPEALERAKALGYSPLFAVRDSMAEANDYAQEIWKSLGDDAPFAITAHAVVLNTYICELLRKGEFFGDPGDIALTLDDVDIINDALDKYLALSTPERDEDDHRYNGLIQATSKKINALREPLLFQEDD